MVDSSAQPRRQGTVQRRGLARRQAILDAAEAVLAEQGYEAATLKAIGDRAQIPTASMYHYFRDRHQVEVELLKWHLGELDAHLDTAVQLPANPTTSDAVTAVIDPMVAYFRKHPSVVELWFRHRQPDLVQLVEDFDAANAKQLWQLMLDRGLLAEGTPVRVVRLAFEAGSRLFDVAFRNSRRGTEATLTEARRMITSYLETYAPGP